MSVKVIRPLSLFCLIFLMACGDNNDTSPKPGSGADLPAHFQFEEVNDDLDYAYHRDGMYTMAEGYLRDNKKQGYWLSFYRNRHKLEKIEHFVNGQQHGPSREFSLNGRLTKEAFYKNGELHGPYTVYKFGQILEHAYYENGKLEGEKRVYFDDNDLRGVLQQKISFKDGVKHGKHIFYNDKGEVVLEYIYEEGVRVEEGGK